MKSLEFFFEFTLYKSDSCSRGSRLPGVNVIQDPSSSWFDFDGQLFIDVDYPSGSERFQNWKFSNDQDSVGGNYAYFSSFGNSFGGHWFETIDSRTSYILCYKPAKSSEFQAFVSF